MKAASKRLARADALDRFEALRVLLRAHCPSEIALNILGHRDDPFNRPSIDMVIASALEHLDGIWRGDSCCQECDGSCGVHDPSSHGDDCYGGGRCRCLDNRLSAEVGA